MSTQEFKERIEKLSAKQKTLLAWQLKALRFDQKPANGHDAKRLVAYVIGDGRITPADLRNHLKDQLPDYMIPSAFIQLDDFPRLPNGKVNNHALPVPDQFSYTSESDYIAPRNAVEEQLAAIWSEVLNFDPVGIHDNFFEIGGDSILSIQIIAKAGKAGLSLKPNALFEHQTIAELALSAGKSTHSQQAASEIITGEVPLLPIQHWFFEEHQSAPQHWNQGLIFDIDNSGDFNAGLLRNAIDHLTLRHDSLRLNFVKEGGKWKASIAKPGKNRVFQKFDLSPLSKSEQETTIREKTNSVQGELNLSEGALFQGIYFDCGTAQSGKLVLFAHHLLVDAVSWGILVEDLKTIYEQLLKGNEITLPAKNTSYMDWSQYLAQMATSNEVAADRGFWQQQIQGATSLPKDFERVLPVTEESVAVIEYALDINDTKRLRSDALGTYNTRIDEFLLAVLTHVLANWAGTKDICFGLERHGREPGDTGMDLSNSVGWFTAYFPATLNFASNTDSGIMLKSVKEQLRKIPHGGISYGLLRYFDRKGDGNVDLNHRPSVIFNYLGNLAPFNAAKLGPGKELREGTRHVQSERHHMLEINAFIQDDQLKMRWGYSRELHRPDTIHNLMEAFEQTLFNFIAHCSAPETGAFTPSDFPEAGLSQDELDNLLGEIE